MKLAVWVWTLCWLWSQQPELCAQQVSRDLGAGTSLVRGATEAPKHAAAAARATQAPSIDGKDTDEVWRRAPVVDDFVQYFPRPDEASRFGTHVQFAFDAHNLYVFARMLDPAPDSIVTRIGRRDVDYPADWFGITLDGYHDRHTGQEFRVSAGGGLYDALRLSDGTPGLSPSWDGVWEAKTTVDAQGWTAEMRIPFSQIRFGAASDPVFGLLVRRNVGRDDSEHAWPRVDAKRAFASWISQGGDLVGVTRTGRNAKLEVSPYSVTRNVARTSGTSWTHPTEQAFGADFRYGLTPNVSLNATINPDFGQVEADPAQLNLSAYELFFEERRPFFLEGSAIFAFNAWCDNVLGQGCTTGPLYTRRIGRAPQLASRYGNAASPLTSRILGAGKLSGRLGNGMSFGVLGASTARAAGTNDRTIEPQTDYLVLRALRDIAGGHGEYGVLFTRVHRELDEWSEPFLRRDATVGGLSARYRFGRDLQFDGSYLASLAQGSRAAFTAMQGDGVHRYQRVGGGLAIDSTRTSLRGNAGRLALARVGGSVLWEVSYQSLSPGLDMNDLGFMRRADLQTAQLWMEHDTRNGRGWYRERYMGTALRLSWTFRGLPVGRGDSPWPSFFHVYAMHRLRNTGQLNLFLRMVSPNHPNDDFVMRGGPSVRQDPAYQFYGFWRGDVRRRLTPEFQWSLWSFEQGRGGTEWATAGATLRPTTRLQAALSVIAYRWRDDQQWVGNRGTSGIDTTHYTIARRTMVEVNPTVRVDWTLSPRLTFQWYSQPYLAGVEYADWRELSSPRAEKYDDRFRAYSGSNPPTDYSLQQLRTNAVLRWEFRPGSILYAVWQQRRDAVNTGAPLRSLAAAYDDLFSAHPDNTFVLKVSYWLNP